MNTVIEIRTKELYGNFYENPNKPLVVIIGGSSSGIPIISSDLLEYLKSKYNVLLLAYFGMGDLPKKLERIPLEYFINAVTYFKNKLNLTDNDVILIGNSKGGELVLLLISKYVHPHVAIACVPSCYVWQSIPDNNSIDITPVSSWTFNNKDIPFIEYHLTEKLINYAMKKEYLPIYEESIKMNRNKNAIIKLNNYKGKLLLLSAEIDHYWPSKEMCTLIERNNNNNIKHVVLNLEVHQFLAYNTPSKEIIAFLTQQE